MRSENRKQRKCILFYALQCNLICDNYNLTMVIIHVLAPEPSIIPVLGSIAIVAGAAALLRRESPNFSVDL